MRVIQLFRHNVAMLWSFSQLLSSFIVAMLNFAKSRCVTLWYISKIYF